MTSSYLRNMLTPLSTKCFWMAFHDCTSTITSRSVRGWTGRLAVDSSGPAALKVLDRITSSMLDRDRWLSSDRRRHDLVEDREVAAGAQRRNGLDASSHAKQHMSADGHTHEGSRCQPHVQEIVAHSRNWAAKTRDSHDIQAIDCRWERTSSAAASVRIIIISSSSSSCNCLRH